MIRAAIIEDQEKDASILVSCLQRYGSEQHMEIEISCFQNGILFLRQYRGNCDIIFMDIDMPMIDGMNTARSLRQIDPHVLLIFVTALARYALNGYEVNAFDFIVKPVQYSHFTGKMQRALKKLSAENRTKVLIKSSEKTFSVYTDEIIYVDIFNHMLSFHTTDNVVVTRGTIKDAVQTLNNSCFTLCNKSCIVNLRYVQMIENDEILLSNGERLQISRPRKTEFMQHIADFYGNKKINMGRF